MGKKRPSKILNLQFVDGDLEGLEVRMKSPPIQVFLSLSSMADLGTEDITMEGLKGLLQPVVDHLLSWNLEENDDDPNPGAPISADMDGLLSLGMESALEIMSAWIDGVAGVATPLDRLSKDGSPSLVASLPMELQLPSQAS